MAAKAPQGKKSSSKSMGNALMSFMHNNISSRGNVTINNNAGSPGITDNLTKSLAQGAGQLASTVTLIGRYAAEKTDVMSIVAPVSWNWLSSINHKAVQVDLVSRAVPGSWEWFLKDKLYRNWVEGCGDAKRDSHNILHGIGAAGAGKTFLASRIVNNLQERFAGKRNVAILYAFCSKHDGHTTSQVLGSLLRQVAEHTVFLGEEINKQIVAIRKKNDAEPSDNEYIDILQAILEKPDLSQVFIVLDSPTELGDEGCRTVVGAVLSIAKSNLLITSRESATVDRCLATCKYGPFVIETPKDQIRELVRRRVSANEDLRILFRDDPDVEQEIISAVVAKSQGLNATNSASYLLVSLQLNSLMVDSSISIDRLREAIESLPTSVDDVYQLTLEKIKNQDTEDYDLAERVLLWVAHSFEFLHISVLAEAVAFHLQSISSPYSTINPSAEAFHDLLIASCKGLITISKGSQTVRFVHPSAQAFITEHFEHLDAHSTIASSCARYLSFQDLHNFAADNTLDFESWVKADTLARYAYHNWGRHAKKGQNGLAEDVNAFILNNPAYPSIFKSKFRILDGVFGPMLDVLGPIHVAALHDIPDVVPLLLGSINDVTSVGRTSPLQIACHRRNISFVRALLADEASAIDIYYINGLDESSFGYASSPDSARQGGDARKQQTHMITLLLKRADLDSRRARESGDVECYQERLQQAMRGLHKNLWRFWGAEDARQVVDLLLARVGDRNTISKSFATDILYTAARIGNHDAVQRLLDWGVDVNSKPWGNSPLIGACMKGHVEVVKVLLGFPGVNLNDTGDLGFTALDYALHEGYDQIVSLLKTGKKSTWVTRQGVKALSVTEKMQIRLVKA